MKVDIRKLLHEKNPRLSRCMPGFIKGYLRRVVHEDEVNRYLEDFSHLPAIDFIRASLSRMNITYEARGMEQVDPGGRYIFASNHPFGGLDGVMLAVVVSERFGDVRVVVNDLLMNVEPMKSIFIPINKHGRQKTEYAAMYKEAFASDIPIITFPAGLCSRRHDGVVTDLQWRPNFVKQAIATQRDIVPVFFQGELSNFFYRLSNFRKKVGVKANIEMLYLVDEMFRQSGSHFTIRIGKPIEWSSLQVMKPIEAANSLRAAAYALRDE